MTSRFAFERVLKAARGRAALQSVSREMRAHPNGFHVRRLSKQIGDEGSDSIREILFEEQLHAGATKSFRSRAAAKGFPLRFPGSIVMIFE